MQWAVVLHGGTLFGSDIKRVKDNADLRKNYRERGVTPVTVFRKTGEVTVFEAPEVNGAAHIPQSHLKAAA